VLELVKNRGRTIKNLFAGGGKIKTYGTITAPNHKGIPYQITQGGPWAGDLGALVNNSDLNVKMIDFAAVPEWLKKMESYRETCLFIAGFDVLFDAQETLDAYHEFKDYFKGWPLAYVAQNGAENLPIPDDCAAVFIAGTTEWKESHEAITVIQQAQAMGKHIHIGRVNWWRRYQIFAALPGSENFTFDGNRQAFDGTDNAIEAWTEYEERTATRRIVLPTLYNDFKP
jgi:hypothetical protein